jgi:hypothetical protein
MRLPERLRLAGMTLALVAGLGAMQPGPAKAIAIGNEAPSFSLKTIDGHTFDTAKLKDKRALLMVFWASW